MAVFRCTQKLLKELKRKPEPDVADEDMLSSWHANFLWFDHRKCVLFTHTQTRYAVFLSCLKKPQLEDIGNVFRKQLVCNLARNKIPADHIDLMMAAHESFIFTKTNSRSVLASMNDQVNRLGWMVDSYGTIMNVNPTDIAEQFNDTPMGTPDGYIFPDRAMRTLLDDRLSDSQIF